MLLAYIDKHKPWEVVGQDVDLRCVKMASLNLALRNQYGWVLWGNTLANEVKLAYRTGFNGRGFVRKVEPDQLADAKPESRPEESPSPIVDRPFKEEEDDRPSKQLDLF